MTNVFRYFGIQDVADLAARVRAGDPEDLRDRAGACSDAGRVLVTAADGIEDLSRGLTGWWEGDGADAARTALAAASAARRTQGEQLTASAEAFWTVAAALSTVQGLAATVVAQAEALGALLDRVLDDVRDAVHLLSPVTGLVSWGVEKITGVDVEAEAQKLLLEATAPLLQNALDLVSTLQDGIRAYEQVLGTQGEVLRVMPGVVRTDAGPLDAPGDADLRRGAYFRAVYGRDPVGPDELLMARALDVQGSDATNTDPNARVVVMRIDPVPGAGVVHGDAFISSDAELNPFSAGGFDEGDARGFDPTANPEDSRVSFYVDYETGVVVVRQNASHSVGGDELTGDPSVGLEQDPSGAVRLRIDAANPLAPQIAQDANVSVRGDLVIDPHGGTGPASVSGEATRFPSWEAYQNRDGQPPATVLQHQEEEVVPRTGPLVGLPQPTVPVGADPTSLPDWRAQHHPDQGHDPFLDNLLQFPTTRGDDFYEYPLPVEPYPSVDDGGRLQLPHAARVG